LHTISRARILRLMPVVCLLIGVGGVALLRVSAQSDRPKPTSLITSFWQQDTLALSNPTRWLFLQQRNNLPMPHTMTQQPADNVIDGAVNPELIPDSVAFRLYFTVVAPVSASASQTRAQAAHLSRVGLGDQDKAALLTTLATFSTQHAVLIKSYNDGVAAAQATGVSPTANYATFAAQQDALVQTTRDELGLALTPDGLARLNAHIQGEKRRMKIQVTHGPSPQ
jgi:hypothetical protein